MDPAGGGQASGRPIQDVLCPLATSSCKSFEELEDSDVSEIRAYKLGKKRWSYNQCELVLTEEGGPRTVHVLEAVQLGNANLPDPQKESGVSYQVRLSNGHRIRVDVHVVYDAPRQAKVHKAAAQGSGTAAKGPRYQWVAVSRSACKKGCQGPVLRSIQRYGRLGRRSGVVPLEDNRDKIKEARFMYLSIDEAGTHVGVRRFRLVAGAFDDSGGERLLGSACSMPIRVLANNDVPTGAAFISLHIPLRSDWEGWADCTCDSSPEVASPQLHLGGGIYSGTAAAPGAPAHRHASEADVPASAARPSPYHLRGSGAGVKPEPRPLDPEPGEAPSPREHGQLVSEREERMGQGAGAGRPPAQQRRSLQHMRSRSMSSTDSMFHHHHQHHHHQPSAGDPDMFVSPSRAGRQAGTSALAPCGSYATSNVVTHAAYPSRAARQAPGRQASHYRQLEGHAGLGNQTALGHRTASAPGPITDLPAFLQRAVNNAFQEAYENHGLVHPVHLDPVDSMLLGYDDGPCVSLPPLPKRSRMLAYGTEEDALSRRNLLLSMGPSLGPALPRDFGGYGYGKHEEESHVPMHDAHMTPLPELHPLHLGGSGLPTGSDLSHFPGSSPGPSSPSWMQHSGSDFTRAGDFTPQSSGRIQRMPASTAVSEGLLSFFAMPTVYPDHACHQPLPFGSDMDMVGDHRPPHPHYGD